MILGGRRRSILSVGRRRLTRRGSAGFNRDGFPFDGPRGRVRELRSGMVPGRRRRWDFDGRSDLADGLGFCEGRPMKPRVVQIELTKRYTP